MFQTLKKTLSFRFIASVVNICFIFSFMVPSRALAETPAELGMPVPGSMVNLTAAYVPVIAKGLRVHPENPILFDFIIDTGNTGFKAKDEGLKKESEKLIKYFLASLTTPEKDLWVNLSPYEKDRIIPDQLGQTEMGRDMLAQDYMLKQITASLIYPEKELGKEFWGKVYAKAQALYGSTEVPVNTFNKVWIVADKAKIYVHENTAFVVASHLKVMLEEDYLSMTKHEQVGVSKATNNVGSQIVREIVLPELDKEVNQGKNFANLRQIFNSMILATWYKKNLKEALLNQVYSNKNKVAGVDVEDPTIKDQIYQEYLKAYKKGVFNYIKDDIQANGQTKPKKYFSGGVLGKIEVEQATPAEAGEFAAKGPDGAMVAATVQAARSDRAMTAEPDSGLLEIGEKATTPDQIGSYFDEFWKTHQIQEPEHQAVELVSNGSINPGMRILSLGAGLGQNEFYFVETGGAQVVAVDASDTAVEYQNTKAREMSLEGRIRAYERDFTQPLNLGKDDGGFDVVFAHQSLLYFDDRQMGLIISEIKKQLKPGGRVYISVRSMDDYKYKDNSNRVGTNRAIGPEDNVERRFFTEEDIRGFFVNAGFKDIEIKTVEIPRFDRPLSTVFYLSATSDQAMAAKNDNAEDYYGPYIDEAKWEAAWVMYYKLKTLLGSKNELQQKAAASLITWAQGDVSSAKIPADQADVLRNRFGTFSPQLKRVIKFNYPKALETDEAMVVSAKVNAANLARVIDLLKVDGLDRLLLSVLTNHATIGLPADGLATVSTRRFIERHPQIADIQGALQERMEKLFKNDPQVETLVMDGQQIDVNHPQGRYVVVAQSIDQVGNLKTEKATGTSISIFKREGDQLKIVTSISVQWGADVRVIVSTQKGTFAYKLNETSGELKPILNEQGQEGLEMDPQGKYISLGGITDTWPQGMRDYLNQRLINHKTRHSGSNVVDAYMMLSNGGLMTGWVTLAEAFGIAQLMTQANGLAVVQNEQGEFVNILDLKLTQDDVTSNRRVFIYAGVENLVQGAVDFIGQKDGRGDPMRSTIEEQTVRPVELRELFQQHLNTQLRLPAQAGLPDNVRQRLEETIRKSMLAIEQSFTQNITLGTLEEGSRGREIIDALKEELIGDEHKIFDTDERGQEYLHSLAWIVKNLPNPARKLGKNSSGDEQKILDFIFNQIFKFKLRMLVHAIVSEENDKVIYGSGNTILSVDGWRVVCFLDPIDGSSQLGWGGSFGSLFSFGLLEPRQSIEEGTINPRQRVMTTLELSIGPRVSFKLTNRMHPSNQTVVTKFLLTNSAEGIEEVRRVGQEANILDAEIAAAQWDGLNVVPNEKSVLLLAGGGSPQETNPIWQKFIDSLNGFGSVSTYSGGLIHDEDHNLTATQMDGRAVVGRMLWYAQEKYRRYFEVILEAVKNQALGGETIDGRQPVLNLSLEAKPGESLSALATSYFSGSTWITKKLMCWSYYMKEHLQASAAKLSQEDLDRYWDEFEVHYTTRTRLLVSQITTLKGKSEQDVRKALLSYVSTDDEKNYFPWLIEQEPQVVASKIGFDAAMTVEELSDIVLPLIGPYQSRPGMKFAIDGQDNDTYIEAALDPGVGDYEANLAAVRELFQLVILDFPGFESSIEEIKPSESDPKTRLRLRLALMSIEKIKGILKGKRVLVVDDEPWVSSQAAMFLKIFGAIVEIANDGQEAIDRLAQKEQEPFDLVLTDFDMPNVTGGELATHVHTLYPQIPLVGWTGQNFEDRKPQFRKFGYAMLKKPAAITIYAALAQALEGKDRAMTSSVTFTPDAGRSEVKKSVFSGGARPADRRGLPSNYIGESRLNMFATNKPNEFKSTLLVFSVSGFRPIASMVVKGEEKALQAFLQGYLSRPEILNAIKDQVLAVGEDSVAREARFVELVKEKYAKYQSQGADAAMTVGNFEVRVSETGSVNTSDNRQFTYPDKIELRGLGSFRLESSPLTGRILKEQTGDLTPVEIEYLVYVQGAAQKIPIDVVKVILTPTVGSQAGRRQSVTWEMSLNQKDLFRLQNASSILQSAEHWLNLVITMKAPGSEGLAGDIAAEKETLNRLVSQWGGQVRGERLLKLIDSMNPTRFPQKQEYLDQIREFMITSAQQISIRNKEGKVGEHPGFILRVEGSQVVIDTDTAAARINSQAQEQVLDRHPYLRGLLGKALSGQPAGWKVDAVNRDLEGIFVMLSIDTSLPEYASLRSLIGNIRVSLTYHFDGVQLKALWMVKNNTTQDITWSSVSETSESPAQGQKTLIPDETFQALVSVKVDAAMMSQFTIGQVNFDQAKRLINKELDALLAEMDVKSAVGSVAEVPKAELVALEQRQERWLEEWLRYAKKSQAEDESFRGFVDGILDHALYQWGEHKSLSSVKILMRRMFKRLNVNITQITKNRNEITLEFEDKDTQSWSDQITKDEVFLQAARAISDLPDLAMVGQFSIRQLGFEEARKRIAEEIGEIFDELDLKQAVELEGERPKDQVKQLTARTERFFAQIMPYLKNNLPEQAELQQFIEDVVGDLLKEWRPYARKPEITQLTLRFLQLLSPGIESIEGVSRSREITVEYTANRTGKMGLLKSGLWSNEQTRRFILKEALESVMAFKDEAMTGATPQGFNSDYLIMRTVANAVLVELTQATSRNPEDIKRMIGPQFAGKTFKDVSSAQALAAIYLYFVDLINKNQLERMIATAKTMMTNQRAFKQPISIDAGFNGSVIGKYVTQAGQVNAEPVAAKTFDAIATRLGITVVDGEAGGKTGRLLALGGTSGENFTGLVLLEDGRVYYVKPSLKVDLTNQFEGLLITTDGEIVGARASGADSPIQGKEERFDAVIQSGGYELVPNVDQAMSADLAVKKTLVLGDGQMGISSVYSSRTEQTTHFIGGLEETGSDGIMIIPVGRFVERGRFDQDSAEDIVARFLKNKLLYEGRWARAKAKAALSGEPDQALTSSTGGIDLNSKNLLLDVNGDKINITFDPALIEQFKQGDFSGVRPVILNIVPIANMYPLLGIASLSSRREDEKLVKV